MRRQVCRIPGALSALLMMAVLLGSARPEAPVADAAMRGDVGGVRALLAAGSDVNGSQGDGMTALHWAAEDGALELVELLVTAGARLGVATRVGALTPLHLASRAGESAVLDYLLASGADPNARTSTGVTPLHFAAASGEADAIRSLVRHGAQVNSEENAAAQTPLIFAAAGDRAEAITALIEMGADPAHATKVVDVPARLKEDEALRERRNQIKTALWGTDLADPGYADTRVEVEEEPGTEGEMRSSPAMRPLSFADLMGKSGGMTALHHAVRQGNTSAALALMAGGAEINQTSADGSTPLLTATINGHFDLAMDLLERGADPNLRSDAGAGALFVALNLQWGSTSWYPQPTAYHQQHTTYLELMRALLEAGADPNARLERELWYTEFQGNRLGVSMWGATPFWRAAYGTDVEAMRLLRAFGADPGIATRRKPGRSAEASYGNEEEERIPVGGESITPVHAATGAGYGLGFAGNAHVHAPGGWLPAVRYLVEEMGADVNARDHEGYTPLHNAASRGDNELIEYLVNYGADVTAVSIYGQTTADMANGPYQRINPFPQTIALLVSLGALNNNNCVSC